PALPTEGPARYYRLPGARGTIGFISAISEHFCHQCNRLRLTADGRLRPCLMWDREVDLRSVLRQGASEDDLREVIRRATLEKPWGHRLGEGVAPQGRTMSEIGG
ncbi:MAG: GTP 3',8-cyclase MoaA, partial [Chloroflexota bacterium]